MSKPKMICPDCGTEMNHHAVKIDYGVDDPKFVAVFGGAVKEAHTCPECGRTEMRAAEDFPLPLGEGQGEGVADRNRANTLSF